MIEVVTEIFTTMYRNKQDYMHDTVPFTLRSQRFSNRSNVVLLGHRYTRAKKFGMPNDRQHM